MLKKKGYLLQRLLIFFATALVVLIIVTVFISYTADITRAARINMLKMTKMQLMSTNRVLLSRAKILNLNLLSEVDASILDDEYQGGRLTWGQMIASKENLPIFVIVNKLRLKDTETEGSVILYPEELEGERCSLEYSQPVSYYNEQGELVHQAARYLLRTKQC